MKPKISVLMPTYNMEALIEAAISSALEQSLSDFELIIVDDGSQDKTLKLISQYKDPRIKVYKNEQNLGTIRNFNRCLELINAPYFIFLHADDKFLPQTLEKTLAVLESKPEAGYVFATCQLIDEQGKVIGQSRAFDHDRYFSGEELLRKHHIYGNSVLFPSTLVRTSCLKRIGLFDTELLYTADWDLWLRIEAAGFSVAYISEPLAQYRLHSKSGTSQLEKQGLTEIEHYQMLNKHLNSTYGQTLPKQKLLKRARRQVLHGCFKRARTAFFHGDFKKAKAMLGVVNKWQKDPKIKFNYTAWDMFLASFVLVGVIIE